jgi:acetyl-CoA acyltransferase 2
MATGKKSSEQEKVYLISGLRTPFGKFGGELKGVSPVDLAVFAGKALLKQLNLSPDLIGHSVFSNVCPSTPDTLYGGRHVILKLGGKKETPGLNINRLCGSGIEAVNYAKHLIQNEDTQCVLVTGSENMSMAPHLTYGGRFGTKYGPLETKDLLWDTLTDEFCQTAMGVTAENLATQYSISREDSDRFSLSSHQKAQKAFSEGLLKDEIVPFETKRGILEHDGHIRNDAKLEDLKNLRPTFSKSGVVTAGSASGIVDGGVALLMGSEKFCKEKHLEGPFCEIGESHVVGVDPKLMGIGPAPAIRGLLEKIGPKSLDEVDLFEINEAFSPQILSCLKDLGLNEEKVNAWGGAIAIGHPLGATGLRLVLTLARQLKYYKKQTGVASACIGGGQGIALALKRG